MLVEFYQNYWETNEPGLRFGSAVTVVEMDGEIDMDNMEEQLKDAEGEFRGFRNLQNRSNSLK